MKDAATVPLNSQKWPIYHSSRVQGCNFFFFTLSLRPDQRMVHDVTQSPRPSTAAAAPP